LPTTAKLSPCAELHERQAITRIRNCRNFLEATPKSAVEQRRSHHRPKQRCPAVAAMASAPQNVTRIIGARARAASPSAQERKEQQRRSDLDWYEPLLWPAGLRWSRHSLPLRAGRQTGAQGRRMPGSAAGEARLSTD